MRTHPARTERLHVRLDANELACLNYLCTRWSENRSRIVRAMIVGAASAQLAEQEEADLARDIEAEFSHAIGRAPSGIGSNELSPET